MEVNRIDKVVLIMLVATSFFGLNSCKDNCIPCDDPTNPDCENYDPCYGKKTINSFFKVRPGDRGFPPPEEWCDLIPCDTFNASSVRFDAPDGNPDNSTYEWLIGTEAEPRVGKGFEVDFSNYLSKGNWESHITVTLTIRTPMNSCLVNPQDTLVVTSRDLFFTEESLFYNIRSQKHLKYSGFFTDNKDNKIVLEFIRMDSGSFRGLKAPILLTVGVPGYDTLAVKNCSAEGCTNYLHSITRVSNPESCEPKGIHLSITEWILSADMNRIKVIWEFTPPSSRIKYEFIGERL